MVTKVLHERDVIPPPWFEECNNRGVHCCADGHSLVLHVRDAVPPHPLKRTCYHQQPMIGEGSQRVTPASPGDGAADLWGTGKEGEGDSNNGEGNGMVNLTYDPMLNCYYDHDTQQYYEL